MCRPSWSVTVGTSTTEKIATTAPIIAAARAASGTRPASRVPPASGCASSAAARSMKMSAVTVPAAHRMMRLLSVLGNAACRNAPSPATPSSSTVAARVGNDGSAKTARSAAAAAAPAPTNRGTPARGAATAPTAPSATALATATARQGDPAAAGRRRGAAVGRRRGAAPFTTPPFGTRPRARRVPATRRVRARAVRRLRGRGVPQGARVRDRLADGALGLARAEHEQRAPCEHRPAQARRQARSVLGPVLRSAEIDHEREAEVGRRVVLTHDQLPAARARRPVHEARGVAGHVRPYRAHDLDPCPVDRLLRRSNGSFRNRTRQCVRGARPGRDRDRLGKRDAGLARSDEHAERGRGADLDTDVVEDAASRREMRHGPSGRYRSAPPAARRIQHPQFDARGTPVDRDAQRPPRRPRSPQVARRPTA